MSPHPFAEVAHAVIDGKQIQQRLIGQSDWKDVLPGKVMNGFLAAEFWTRGFEWRIKPEELRMKWFDCEVFRTQHWMIRVPADDAEEAKVLAKAAFSDGEPPDIESPLEVTAVEGKTESAK